MASNAASMVTDSKQNCQDDFDTCAHRRLRSPDNGQMLPSQSEQGRICRPHYPLCGVPEGYEYVRW